VQSWCRAKKGDPPTRREEGGKLPGERGSTLDPTLGGRELLENPMGLKAALNLGGEKRAGKEAEQKEKLWKKKSFVRGKKKGSKGGCPMFGNAAISKI